MRWNRVEKSLTGKEEKVRTSRFSRFTDVTEIRGLFLRIDGAVNIQTSLWGNLRYDTEGRGQGVRGGRKRETRANRWESSSRIVTNDIGKARLHHEGDRFETDGILEVGLDSSLS